MWPTAYHMSPVILYLLRLQRLNTEEASLISILYSPYEQTGPRDQNARKSSFSRWRSEGEGDETAEACLPCKQSFKDRIYNAAQS